jgi:acyl dehydratase
MIEIPDAAWLRDRIGQEIAVSDWLDVSQERIDRFAEATEDRQWIHVDPVRASAESPFKTTVAHGFLTLSLLSVLTRRAMTFSGIRMAVNYGLNRVRFMAPVPAGTRIRGRFSPVAVSDGRPESGKSVDVTWSVTIEREHGDKPCCVAEWIVRYYPSAERR